VAEAYLKSTKGKKMHGKKVGGSNADGGVSGTGGLHLASKLNPGGTKKAAAKGGTSASRQKY